MPLLEATGLQGQLLDAAGGAPHPDLDSSANYNCGGTAPMTTACATDFAAAAGAGYTLYIKAGTGFTGTVIAALEDGAGHHQAVVCLYTFYIDGLNPPTCRVEGNGALEAGDLRLTGAAQAHPGGLLPALPAPLPVPLGPPLPLGAWEVHVDLQ